MASLVTTTVAGTVTINQGASGMGMTFTTPSTGQNSWITWKDGGTTNKWEIGKNTANKLYIHNYAESESALEFDAASHATFGGQVTFTDDLYITSGQNIHWSGNYSFITGNGANTTGFLKFYTSDTPRLTIAGGGAATFSGNVTLNSSLTFSYNNYYFEAGTGSIYLKNAGGNTVLGMKDAELVVPGVLTGTTATFSGTGKAIDLTGSNPYIRVGSTVEANSLRLGWNNDSGYNYLLGQGAWSLRLGANNTPRLTIASAGLVSMTDGLAVTGTGSFTGALTGTSATFSGNVLANGNNFYYNTKVITSSYVSVFDVNNTSGLSTDFSFSVKGTANSVVIPVRVDVLTNHYQDITIKTQSGAYTTLTIKVTTANNEDCTVWMKQAGANNVTCYIYVQTTAGGTVDWTPSEYSGSSLEHVCGFGFAFSTYNGGSASTSRLAGGGELTLAGGLTATTGAFSGAVTTAALAATTGSFGGHVTPSSNVSFNLGSSGLRWLNIYGSAGNFSGALTGTTATFSGIVVLGNNSRLSDATTSSVSLNSSSDVLLTAVQSGAVFAVKTWNGSTQATRLQISGAGATATTTITGLLSLANETRTLDVKLKTSPATGDMGVQFRAGSGDYLGLAAGGGTGIGIVIDDSNKVGIGTSAPSGLLDLYDPASGDNKLRFHNSSTGTGTSNGSRIGLNGHELFINNLESSTIKIYTQSTQTNGICIANDGKVGVGTVTAHDKLHVQGNILQLDSSPEYHFGTTSASHRNWRVACQENVSQGFEIASGTTSAGTGAPSDTYTNRFVIKGATGQIQFNSYGGGTHTGTSAYKLSVDASGNIIETSIGSGAVDGSGTTNYISKWTDSDTLGNSSIHEGAAGSLQIEGPSAGRFLTLNAPTTGGYITFETADTAFADIGTPKAISGIATYSTTDLMINARSGGKNIVFGMNGYEKVRIDSNGKVGIATATPYYKLEVRGTDNNQRLGIQPNTATAKRMHLAYNSYLSSNTNWYGLYAGSTGMITFYEEGAYQTNVGGIGFNIDRIASDNTAVGVNPAPKMIITTDSKVGIGTAAPATPLHVWSTSYPQFRVSYSSTYYFTIDHAATLNVYNNDWIVRLNNSEKFRIKQDGKIGIGTNNPLNILTLHQAAGANIRFQNATTGRYFIVGEGVGANDKFSFRGNSYRSTDTLTVDFANNRVGINQISPSAGLEIKGAGGSTGLTFKTTDNVGNTGFWVMDGGRVGVHYFPFLINQDHDDTNYPASCLMYAHSATPFTIKTDGKVGIGTTAPGANFEILKNGAFASGQSVAVQMASALQAFGGNNDMRLYFHEGGTTYRGMMGYAHAGSTYMGIWDSGSNLNPTLVCQTGKVGIGTTAPDRMLHLYGGPSGQATPTTSSLLVLEDDGSNNYISFLNPNTASAGIMWGDPQDSARAQIIYSHADNKMTLNAGGAVHMTITSAGRVFIGDTTASDAQLRVKQSTNNSWAVNVINQQANAYGLSIDTSSSSTTNAYNFAAYTPAGTGFFLENTGDVGIGTSGPSSKLHIYKTTNAFLNGLTIENPDAGSSASAGMYLNCNGKTLDMRIYNALSGNFGYINSSGTLYTGLYHDGGLVLSAKSGKVGIGTTAPSGAKLDVRTNSASLIDAGATVNIEEDTAWTQGLALYINNADVYNADYAAACIGVANSGSNIIITAGAKVVNNPASSNGYKTLNSTAPSVYRQMNGAHVFYGDTGKTANTLYTPTERMRIDDDGNVGIGVAAPGAKLHVTGAPGNSTYLSYLFNSATHSQAHGLNVQIASSGAASYGLRVNTGGDTNALAVMGDGNVGMGTGTPAGQLHVYDNFAGERNHYIDNHNASGIVQLNLRAGTGNEYLSLSRSTTSAAIMVATDPFYIKHYHSSAWHNSIVVAADGRIGMGTPSPDNPLEVVGADSGIKISSASNNRPHLRLECGTVEKMRLSANALYGAIGDDSDTNRYMVFKDGKVGIGTTGPGLKLEVKTSGSASTQYALSLTNPNNQAGDGGGAGIRFSTSSGPSGAGNEANKYSSIEAFDVNNWGSNSGLSFTTSLSYTKTKSMVIDRNGKVGIGTVEPEVKLTVRQSAQDLGIRLYGHSAHSGSYMNFRVDSGGHTNLETSGGSYTKFMIGSGYFILQTAANAPIYNDFGGTYFWRDVDSSNAIRMSLNSADGALTVNGALTAGTGSKIVSTTTDSVFKIETNTVTNGFPVLDLVSSHTTVGGRIRSNGTDLILLDKDLDCTFTGDVAVNGALTGTTATFSGNISGGGTAIFSAKMTAGLGHFENSSHTIVDIKSPSSGNMYSMLRMTSNGTQDNYIRADVGNLVIDGSHTSVNITKALAVTGALTGTTATFSGLATFSSYIKVSGLDLGVGWGDLNTGVFGRGTANSNSYLQFRTNGTSAIHIDSSQNTTLSGDVKAAQFYTGYDWTTRSGGLNIGSQGLSTGAVSFFDGTLASSASIYRDSSSVFFVGARGGVATTGMAIDTNGNVGIGDSTPNYKLDVNGTGRFTGTLTAAGATFNGVVLPSADGAYNLGDNTTRWATIFADTFYGNGANITSLNASNLSSGTVAAARLGSGSSITSKFLRGDNTWQTVSSGGGSGTVTEVTVGTGLDVSNGTTTPNITLDLAELSTAGSVTGTDDFVVIDGSSTRKEQMNTIGLSGFSGYYGLINRIGKGSADSNTYVTPNSSGRLGFAEGTGVSLTFGSNLITFATGTSSDYRLKKNISTFNSDAWAKVKSVNLRKFDFDEDAFKTAIDSPDPEIVGVPKSYTDNVGFIAHELAEVRIDGAVIGEKDAVDSDGNLLYQKVNYNALVPVLWGALNEAISKIETLESKVQALEDK